MEDLSLDEVLALVNQACVWDRKSYSSDPTGPGTYTASYKGFNLRIQNEVVLRLRYEEFKVSARYLDQVIGAYSGRTEDFLEVRSAFELAARRFAKSSVFRKSKGIRRARAVLENPD